MITNDTFRQLLDKTLKHRNMLKKDRDSFIGRALIEVHQEDRDTYLDEQESITRKLKEKPNIKSEDEEQIDFVSWFRKTYPEDIIFAVWNGGSRTLSERPKQLLMGVYPGVSDLIVWPHNIFIEMKRSDGGAGQSEKQKAFEHVIHKGGGHYMVANGCDDGIKKYQQIINKIKLDY